MMLFILIFFALYRFYFRQHKSKVGLHIEGFMAIGSYVLLGYLSAHFTNTTQKPTSNKEAARNVNQYFATIISTPIKTKKTVKYEASINQVKLNETWINNSSKAILYFVSESAPELQYGDKLLIQGTLEFIKKQSNPHAFDYAEYKNRKGVYLQAFIYNDDYLLIKHQSGYSIKYYSLLAGDFFDQIISSFITSDREQNMVRAMVIGRKSPRKWNICINQPGPHIFWQYLGFMWVSYSYYSRSFLNQSQNLINGFIT